MIWIVTVVYDIPTYEGLPNLASFISEFKYRVSKLQHLLELEEALNATPTIWWDAHKTSTKKWKIF